MLLVDDDPVPRGAVAAMLRVIGYDPVVFTSCEEAIRWPEERRGTPPSAVLLDVAMPGGDGVACHARLVHVLPGVPIVFISGYAEGGRAQALASAGEAAFLAKPFDITTLGKAIADATAAAPRPDGGRVRPKRG